MSMMSNRDGDSNNLQEIHNQLEKLKEQVQILTLENEDKIRTIKNMEAARIKLQHQLKTADDERNRLKTWYIPRLKETRKYQKELSEECDKIRSDAELLPSMFRAEAVFRNQCRKERDEAVEKMNESVKRTQFLERQCADLKAELERKERLSLQAIAARSSMKSHLDNATQHLKDTENRVMTMMSRIKEAEEEVAYYKKRHDEMFSSVSALNKRIEELESHKLHLLDKLKGYGDKGGLEYIVKTQKLD
jgi:chromosome segregation ATPase